MEQIDARRALELLIDIVNQCGEDTVYEKVPSLDATRSVCRYEYEGNPSCLVGKALHRAGAQLDVLMYLDELGLPADKINMIHNVTLGAALVFQAAQDIQDSGGTWGEALEKARRKYEYLISQEVQ